MNFEDLLSKIENVIRKYILHLLYYMFSTYTVINFLGSCKGLVDNRSMIIYGVLTMLVLTLAKLNIKNNILRYVFVVIHCILFLGFAQMFGLGIGQLRGHSFNCFLLYSYLLPNKYVTFLFVAIFSIKYTMIGAAAGFSPKILGALKGLYAGALTTSIGYVTAFVVVGHLGKERAKFEKLSITDALTGTFTLNHIITLGKELLEKKKDITLVMLDLNNFKQLNDNFGHMAGNVILKDISTLLIKKTADYQGVIGRIGGDEFVVLLQDDNHVDVKAFVDYLYDNIHKQAFEVDPDLEKIHLSFAFGIAGSSSKTGHIAMDKLLYEADVNMYYNKYQTKNNSLTLESTGFFLPDQILQYLNVLAEKDMYTYVHSEHVAKFSADLALHIGLPMEKVAEIYIAGWIHDIGKSLIPNKILRKSVTLEENEYLMIKEHIDIGINIIRRLKTSESIENGMKYHHENFDGSGYPFQRSGEDIPIEGRILRIVDTYSAMTIKRVYRHTLTKEEAVQEILKHKGTQFDPYLADEFAKMLHEEHKSGIIEKVHTWIEKMQYRLTLTDTVEFRNTALD